MNFLLRLLMIVFLLPLDSNAQSPSTSAEWQWSVVVPGVVSNETNDNPRAFLWVPVNCKQVRAVVVGQHNMIEEGIFEHSTFRKMLSELDFAVVWITPAFTATFDFNNNAATQFNEMMKSFADSSGYAELEFAPVIPLGHSALASYPWNFAAWNPKRTLAIISIHGDAPLTKLTGSGRPNPDWGDRTIEGVPGLFVMGEYEWREDRITPGFEYVKKFPETPISFFADAGHGHFDYSDELIEYISLFIGKAAKYRLPARPATTNIAELKPIYPGEGWLIDRWRKDSLPLFKASPYNNFKGQKNQASWVFDKELAVETEKFYARARGKKNQHLGFIQNGKIVEPTGGHAVFTIPFTPLEDGMRFHLKTFFADTSKIKPVMDHAVTPLVIERICGPVAKVNDTTFQIRFYRLGFNNSKRSNDIWLLASNKGDKLYKSAVQQLDLHFPLFNKEGKAQQITFPTIANQKSGTATIRLEATSNGGMPVYYYVKEGPAIVKVDTLFFTKIPPKTRYPVKISVVAWQYGSSVEPKLKSAEPVERSFYFIK